MAEDHKRIHSSKSVEWYTPPKYVHAARVVMKDIDLDPASCPEANSIVAARKFYTKMINGLRRPWHGRVFLNPPYGKTGNQSNQGIWSRYLLREYEAGRVSQAILLVNNVPDRQWFWPLWNYPICFVRKRILFLGLDLKPQKQPTHGNVFVYLGPHPLAFYKVFSDFGHVVMP